MGTVSVSLGMVQEKLTLGIPMVNLRPKAPIQVKDYHDICDLDSSLWLHATETVMYSAE